MDDGTLERMNKNLTTDMKVKGIEHTLEVGVSFGVNIIFGNLEDDIDYLKKDVEFLLKYVDCAQIRSIRPVTSYPST